MKGQERTVMLSMTGFSYLLIYLLITYLIVQLQSLLFLSINRFLN